MGERLKLSVVIPTHNTRKLTLNCLAALWLCNPQPDEVIVVDDGSTDNTANPSFASTPATSSSACPRAKVSRRL